jgi:rod shape determining protein RodA
MVRSRVGQIVIGVVTMMITATVPARFYERWTPYFYIASLVLLTLVEVFGQTNNGAQRWLNISFLHFQPSEFAKVSVPMMVAKIISYSSYPPKPRFISLALLIIFIPAFLVAIQPDLGTSILITISGLFILFLSGMSWILIAFGLMAGVALIPTLWYFVMHNYQRDRIMTLLNPEGDPLGAGYHIIQSKIAIGSGGFFWERLVTWYSISASIFT